MGNCEGLSLTQIKNCFISFWFIIQLLIMNQNYYNVGPKRRRAPNGFFITSFEKAKYWVLANHLYVRYRTKRYEIYNSMIVLHSKTLYFVIIMIHEILICDNSQLALIFHIWKIVCWDWGWFFVSALLFSIHIIENT